MTDPDEPDLPTEAILAIQAGRKIEAIKILREHTGMGLAEAKAVVDQLTGEFGSNMPRTTASREDSGLFRLLAALVVIGAIAAAYLLL